MTLSPLKTKQLRLLLLFLGLENCLQGGAEKFLDYFQQQYMYSYEDRLRAVRLFIKLGKRAGKTVTAGAI